MDEYSDEMEYVEEYEPEICAECGRDITGNMDNVYKRIAGNSYVFCCYQCYEEYWRDWTNEHI